GADIKVKGGEVINFCANNYLGLAGDPKVAQFAKEGVEKYGYGMSSVRFICGTQDIHRELEHKIADFLHTDDTILYSSCLDANGGLFHTLLDDDDAIISDALNHASIIDGVRLCKANRFIFKHGDMEDLEKVLKDTQKYTLRLIATDGVFSMNGNIAKLDKICALAEKYNALVMIDDAHSTGFFGKTGRGTPEYRGVEGRVDIITSTLGKALGGASGGFTTGRKEIIDILRQRSRPYLFSNTLAPPIAYTAMKVIDMLGETTQLRDKLEWNTKYFREGLANRGFKITPGVHPIIPIMLGDEKLAHDMARDMLLDGIYVVGFSYPVVPRGQARIRVQMSAAHDKRHLDKALDVFEKVGKKYEVI
ncbi:glycine C-acetyltransferase, partial [candidate division WOR-3 bacterium]|nr:glycine C-acetyltransferase [candidate division WOR-3 bacterium]